MVYLACREKLMSNWNVIKRGLCCDDCTPKRFVWIPFGKGHIPKGKKFKLIEVVFVFLWKICSGIVLFQSTFSYSQTFHSRLVQCSLQKSEFEGKKETQANDLLFHQIQIDSKTLWKCAYLYTFLCLWTTRQWQLFIGFPFAGSCIGFGSGFSFGAWDACMYRAYVLLIVRSCYGFVAMWTMDSDMTLLMVQQQTQIFAFFTTDCTRKRFAFNG